MILSREEAHALLHAQGYCRILAAAEHAFNTGNDEELYRLLDPVDRIDAVHVANILRRLWMRHADEIRAGTTVVTGALRATPLDDSALEDAAVSEQPSGPNLLSDWSAERLRAAYKGAPCS